MAVQLLFTNMLSLAGALLPSRVRSKHSLTEYTLAQITCQRTGCSGRFCSGGSRWPQRASLPALCRYDHCVKPQRLEHDLIDSSQRIPLCRLSRFACSHATSLSNMSAIQYQCVLGAASAPSQPQRAQRRCDVYH